MSFVTSLLWFSTTVLIVHGYAKINHRNVPSNGGINRHHTHGAVNFGSVDALHSDGDESPDETTHSKETETTEDQNQAALNALKSVCKKLCASGQPCPPECSEIYLDPWTYDAAAPLTNSLRSKRLSNGLDGLTFDDYLFMRWLGRDINRRKLN